MNFHPHHQLKCCLNCKHFRLNKFWYPLKPAIVITNHLEPPELVSIKKIDFGRDEAFPFLGFALLALTKLNNRLLNIRPSFSILERWFCYCWGCGSKWKNCEVLSCIYGQSPQGKQSEQFTRPINSRLIENWSPLLSKGGWEKWPGTRSIKLDIYKNLKAMKKTFLKNNLKLFLWNNPSR